jgi:putrescine aminotransferase
LMGKASFREPVEPLLGPVFRVPFGDAAAVEQVLAENANQIAACVFEPIQGEAGAVVPPDDFWPRVRAACDKFDVLLIADEVQTCLGRTGELWGVDHWNVVPDLVTAAKGLGGGVMPVGAVIGPPELWKHLEPNPFLHTSTFGGSPLACAAIIASIHVTLRDKLWEQARDKGNRFLAGLNELRDQFPETIVGVQGRGLLLAMLFPDDATGYRIAAELFRKGVLVAGTQLNATSVRIEPALTIEDALIDEVLGRIKDALTVVAG